MNWKNAEQWASFYYTYARSTLLLAEAAARVYARDNLKFARAGFRNGTLRMEQWITANLTA